MRALLGAVLAALAPVLVVAPASAAEDRPPVVVELFTSQGCSACPPADALLRELAGREEVLPLSLHVDYWDYIGWEDVFAEPAFTNRQKAYARATGRKTIYTPQMIVGGTDDVVGHDAVHAMDRIAAHAEAPASVSIELSRTGDRLDVTLHPQRPEPGPAVVYLVRYLPRAKVAVSQGENAGQVLHYTNVVTSWRQIGRWDGLASKRLRAQVAGPAPVAVLVQRAGQRRMLGAARAR